MFSLRKVRIFALEMKTKKQIEKAVCDYFKVDIDDVYSSVRKSKYPYNIAKSVLIYMLFANGYKSYFIAELFGFNSTMIYRYCGEVQTALKSDTKIKEDVDKINEILETL